jgi:hypothetical protein
MDVRTSAILTAVAMAASAGDPDPALAHLIEAGVLDADMHVDNPEFRELWESIDEEWGSE